MPELIAAANFLNITLEIFLTFSLTFISLFSLILCLIRSNTNEKRSKQEIFLMMETK